MGKKWGQHCMSLGDISPHGWQSALTSGKWHDPHLCCERVWGLVPLIWVCFLRNLKDSVGLIPQPKNIFRNDRNLKTCREQVLGGLFNETYRLTQLDYKNFLIVSQTALLSVQSLIHWILWPTGSQTPVSRTAMKTATVTVTATILPGLPQPQPQDCCV